MEVSMKKYLFDKIVIDGNRTQFYTCRYLTKGEGVFAKAKFGYPIDSSVNNGILFTSLAVDDIFMPKNFKQYLNCLELTKLNDETKEYSILLEKNSGSKQISFGEALKIFVNVFKEDEVKISENQIKLFYEKSYAIYRNAKNNSEVLNKEPEDLIK